MNKGHIMTKYVLKVQVEIPQISHNLYDPCTQISQLFGIFLKKALITCPLSMIQSIHLLKNSQSETGLNLAQGKKRTLVLVANLCEYYTTTRVEYHPDSPCSNFAIDTEIMSFSGKGNKTSRNASSFSRYLPLIWPVRQSRTAVEYK